MSKKVCANFVVMSLLMGRKVMEYCAENRVQFQALTVMCKVHRDVLTLPANVGQILVVIVVTMYTAQEVSVSQVPLLVRLWQCRVRR